MSLPSTQRAWQAVAKATPLVLNASAPVPQPQAGEVLLKVVAVGLNPVDWKILEYNFFNTAFPFVLGFDVAGTVAALGEGVSNVKVGDEVVTFILLTNVHGGLAEYSVTKAAGLVPKGSLSFEEAASLPVAYTSAHDGLDALALKDEWVYIPGGAGGVGHFAVQLAKAKGAKVISSGSKAESIAFVRDVLKADHVLDYSKVDPVAEDMNITGGKGVFASYDATYGGGFLASASVLEQGRGTYIQLGGELPKADSDVGKKIAERGGKSALADLPRYCFSAEGHAKVTAMLAAGVKHVQDKSIKPHIHKVWTFEQAGEAVASLQKAGSNIGKDVVKVA